MSGDLPDNARGQKAVAVSAVFTALSFICVTSRLLTRHFIVRNLGLDDLSVGLAWIFTLGLTIAIYFEVKNGMGLHQDHLSPENIRAMLLSFWYSLWLYYLGLCFTKVGLILQYLRIFTQKWFRTSCWFLLAVTIVYGVWTVFSSAINCIPVSAFWDISIQGKCISHAVSWYTNAAINIATDLAIVSLPMPVLKSLQLQKKQRIALMAVFALGGFVCVISIVRIPSLIAISNSTDVSYSNMLAAMWSAIEVNVAIICASLPALKAAATRFFPRVLGTRSNNLSRQAHESGRGAMGSGLAPKRSATFGSPFNYGEELVKGGPGGHAQGSWPQQGAVRSHIGTGWPLNGDGSADDRAYSDGNGHHDTEMAALSKEINVVTVLEQEYEATPDSSSNSHQEPRTSRDNDDNESEQDLFPGYHERYRGQDYEGRI